MQCRLYTSPKETVNEFSGAGFRMWGLSLASTKLHRLNRLRKKRFLVIPSEARDLLFFAKP
jgi:hypothetical protein